MTTQSKNNNFLKYSDVIIGVLIVLIFTEYNISGSVVFLSAGVVLLLASVLFLHTLQFFYLMFILAPNVMAIKIAGKDNALLGYVVIIFCLYLILKNKLSFTQSVFFKLFLGSVLFLLSLLLNFQSVNFYIRILSFILILNIVYNAYEIDNAKLLRSFIFGNTLNVISAVFYNMRKGIDIFSGAFSGIRDDRNYYAISCAIAIAVLVFVVSYTKHIKLFDIACLIILSFGGILSSSRTFLILFVITMVFFAFSFFKSPSIGIFILLAIAVFYIGRATFLSNLMGSFNILLERFNERNAVGGSGRFEAWNVYLTYLFSSLRNVVFGCGSSNGYLETSILPVSVVEHNSIIQLLFTAGILGTIGYLLIFSSMISIVTYGRKKRFSLLRIMPMLVLIAGYCTVNGAFSDRFIYAFYLCISILIYKSGNNDEKAEELNYENRTA